MAGFKEKIFDATEQLGHIFYQTRKRAAHHYINSKKKKGEERTVGAPILECECVPLVIQHKWDS
jgi:hypothetical protein